MPDAFVTLISVQPAVAVRSAVSVPQQARPQASGGTLGGLYERKRKKQVVRSKVTPPGAS